MENEVWKDIKGYEGLYQVSNLGRVKSLKRYEKSGQKTRLRSEKILKQNNAMGYNYVILSKCSKLKSYRIHRLVAETFISNLQQLPQVNHIDGNKTNNCVDNLEWCTASYNIKEAYRLNLSKTRKVIQYSLSGDFVNLWSSIANASKSLNLDASAIAKCCKGKRNRVGNYLWKYND